MTWALWGGRRAQRTAGRASGGDEAGDPRALQATRGPGLLVQVLLVADLSIVEVPDQPDDSCDVPVPLCSQFLGQSHGGGSLEGPPTPLPHT